MNISNSYVKLSLLSVTVLLFGMFVFSSVYAETVSLTVPISPITILFDEFIPLLDTSTTRNLTSISITANLPCDSSNNPLVIIVAGILGDTTNIIDSSSDFIGNGPRDTCIFRDNITNVTTANIPAINSVFLNHTGSSPVHIPQGVMVTLSGVFENLTSESPTSGEPFDVSQLKAYYKFNEASGPIINQASSAGSIDALSGEDLATTGISYQSAGFGNFDYSATFSNTDKAIGTTASKWQFMSDQNDACVNLWISSTELINGDDLMTTTNATPANGFIWDYRTTGDLRFVTEKAATVTGNTNWGSNLVSDKMYMLTHCHDDSADTFSMYVDGTLVSNAHSAVVPSANTPDYPLYIGDGLYGSGFAGKIAEVSFWQRVLTDIEINALYNNGLGLSLLE